MAATNLCLGSAATTGDMKNNLSKLLREIRNMKLEVQPDIQGWNLGTPASFLPLWHAALMQYSLPLANAIAAQGYELYGKSDVRFLQGVYGVLRDIFQFQPRLPKEKFLRKGYAERKVILTVNILLLCQVKHKQLLASTNIGKRNSSKYKGVRVCCDDPYQPEVTLEEEVELVQHRVDKERLGQGCERLGHGRIASSSKGGPSSHPAPSVQKTDDLYPMRMSQKSTQGDRDSLEECGCHGAVAACKERLESQRCVGRGVMCVDRGKSRQELEIYKCDSRTGRSKIEDPLPGGIIATGSLSPVCTSSPDLSQSPATIATEAMPLLETTPQVNVEVIRHDAGETEGVGLVVGAEAVVESPILADEHMNSPRLELDRAMMTEFYGQNGRTGPTNTVPAASVGGGGMLKEVSASETPEDPASRKLVTSKPTHHQVETGVRKEKKEEERRSGVSSSSITLEGQGSGVSSSSITLEGLSSRIEELGKLVEQVVARCVLVETQVKLATTQQPQQPHPQQTPSDVAAVEVKRSVTSEDHSINEEERKTSVKSLQFLVEGKGHKEGSGTWLSGVLGGSLDRDLSEEGSSSSLQAAAAATPTTPSTEETEQLIKSLRLRAQTTRQFLQQVTSTRPALQQWE